MSVKGIFKVLIGTTVCIVIFSLLIELISANVNGSQFSTDIRKAVLSACEYYSQESYRVSLSYGGTMANLGARVKYTENDGSQVELLDNDGIKYGDFYIGSNTDEIFNNLYSGSPVDMLSALGSVGIAKFDDVNSSGDVHITPMNLGYVYMDKGTIERITRWTLCKNLTINAEGGTSDNGNMIQRWLSDRGDNTIYIKKGGFLVDINSFSIDDIEYNSFNLSTGVGRNNFKSLTGVQLNNVSGVSSKMAYTATIRCTMNIKYTGISILRNIIEMSMGNVNGTGNGTVSGYSGHVMNYSADSDASIGSGVSGSKGMMTQNIVYYNIN